LVDDPYNPDGKTKSDASNGSKTTAFLRSLIKKVTARPAEGEKSETPSEYQKKVANLIK
jgi:hypothetical protein